MVLNKNVITVTTIVLSSWLYVDVYFAHAEELAEQKMESQINDWSIEQSLNFMQQVQIKTEIRQERLMPKADVDLIDELKSTLSVLRARGLVLQGLQDQATLDDLKEKLDIEAPDIKSVVEDILKE